MRILLCNLSQPHMRSLLDIFMNAGYWVKNCLSLDQMRAVCLVERFDAVVVWQEGTIEQLLIHFAHWKQHSGMARFIVLTDRQSGVERALALESGIDQYLIRPFAFPELVNDMFLKDEGLTYDHPEEFLTP